MPIGTPGLLNLHSVIPYSRANGPGRRLTIWFQGCSLRCPGCFNPATHAFAPRHLVAVDGLLEEIRSRAEGLEGITLTGGEPCDQSAELLELLHGVSVSANLSVVLFSGYTREEITSMPLGREILGYADVLIDGRYDPSYRSARGLRGSTNQRIHLLTDRYELPDIVACPSTEVFIDRAGNVSVTGIAPTYKTSGPNRSPTWE